MLASTQQADGRIDSKAKTANASCQTGGGPPCLGNNNRDLDIFLENRFGKGIIDNDGYPCGEKLRGEQTFRSRFCEQSAPTTRSRCDACQRFFVNMSSVRSRAESSQRKGTQKFAPLSSLRASPYVLEMLNKFQIAESRKKNPPPVPVPPDEDDLEVESKDDNDFLVQTALKTLSADNIKGTFLDELLLQQLQCLNQKDGRGFRWKKSIVHWALTLQFHGGKRIIEDIRGNGHGKGGKHGKLEIDTSKCGLFLPANSTLRNYLPPVEVYAGFKDDSIRDFKTAFPKESKRFLLVAWDEIEIRHGLVWNPSTKELLGKAVGPLAEKDAQKEDWVHLNEELATHVIQFFLVSIDGAVSCPIGFHPIVKINGEKVFKILNPHRKASGLP